MSKYDISKFRNVTVALNTPFQKNGSVDVEAVKAVCRYFRDKGIKQMYVCGSTGEGFLLDTEERMLVAETVVNEVGNDMNIIVHVGCPDTRHSCMQKKSAQQLPPQFRVFITDQARKAFTSTGPRLQRLQIFLSSFITFLSLPDLTFP